MKPIKLAVADDHILFRKTLQNYLETQVNVNILLHASNATELLKKLQCSSIDVLIIDISLPELNETELLKVLRHEFPDIKILVLSACRNLSIISELLDLGIYGYVSKLDEPQELLDALMSISNNTIYRNKIFTEALYWNKQSKIKDCNTDTLVLNEREQKILQFLWDEQSNKEIAKQVFLSVRSVEKIRQDMKEKLGIKSTVGLLKYAIHKKIIGF
jgi:DNA-binding NarL/FixJ family response regulator